MDSTNTTAYDNNMRGTVPENQGIGALAWAILGIAWAAFWFEVSVKVLAVVFQRKIEAPSQRRSNTLRSMSN